MGSMEAGDQDACKPIAIVGMACRFPGDATSPQSFFDMLARGRAAWSEVPKDRYNVDAFWHPNGGRQGTSNCRGGHFMTQDLALFDAPFFNISAAEVSALDPQVRILMEVAYESLESAGLPMDKIAGSQTSCYVGCSSKDYDALAGCDMNDMPLYEAVGAGYAMMANRISHFFDFHGPSITLDTACSSSMIALHLACQSIRAGESEMALIGSSQMIFLPGMAAALSSLHFLSEDSRCYSFDDRANGYSRGEGVCVMVLKSLNDALRDGDTIRAVIRGSGTNQDGKTPGITQPSSEAQAALIRSTYKAAGLDFCDTQYFEAHGTGTPVGDPLELGALGATFGASTRNTDQPLYVGSVKTNIGHLEAGAGLAGLLKSVLCLENAVIVPSLNFETPNPRLRLDEWNLKVPTKLIPWPTNGVRRASINSFGYGGSNAHCIIDDAYNYLKARGLRGNSNTIAMPALSIASTETNVNGSENNASPPSSDGDIRQDDLSTINTNSSSSTRASSPPPLVDDVVLHQIPTHPLIFTFSSPDQENLGAVLSSYAKYLNDKLQRAAALEPDLDLENLAFTLSNRRTVFPWRVSVVASSASELATRLGKPITPLRVKKAPKLLFVFTGQGAQWHAMGRELMAHQVYARSVEKADKYLTSLGADWSVLDELAASEEKSQVASAKFSQPLCTVVQIALVNLLAHWGIQPTAVVGHSSGEIPASYAMGALSDEDCWKIAYHRGRLCHAIKEIAPELEGTMLAVGLYEKDVKQRIDDLSISDSAVIACINSPSSVTVSGDSQALARLETSLKASSIFARKLKVSTAYHSPQMKVVADDYHASIRDIKTMSVDGGPVMLSSVTGASISAAELDASYWVRNMVSPVQFDKAVSQVMAAPAGYRRRRDALAIDTIVEIGPHGALQGPLRQIIAAHGKTEGTTYLTMLQRGQDAALSSQEAVAQLWTKGSPVSLLHVNSLKISDGKMLAGLTDLPNYPWNHSRRYWHEPLGMANLRFGKSPRLDLLGKPISGNPHDLTWAHTIRRTDVPWIADHCVEDDILYPAAGMLCAVLEAAKQILDEGKIVEAFEFRDILISRALVIPYDDGATMVLQMKPRKIGTRGSEAPWLEFTVYSQSPDGQYNEHCSGLLKIKYESSVHFEDQEAESKAEWQSCKNEYADVKGICIAAQTPKAFYEDVALAKRSMKYGPLFQCLSSIQRNEMHACTTVQIQDTKAAMPQKFEYDHLIHPVTLDGFLQTIIAAIGPGEGGALVPTSIDSLIVSAHLPAGAGAEFYGFARAERKGFRDFRTDIIFSDKAWTEPKVTIRGCVVTELRGWSNDSMKSGSSIRKMCAQLVWKEDVACLEQKDADHLFRSEDETDTEAPSTQAVTKYLDLQGHKRPDANILEVGAGLGSMTVPIFRTLGGCNGSTPHFRRYVVSDRAAGSLKHVETSLKDWQAVVEYKMLDIDKDPVNQGFEEESFDTIVANNLLLQTKCLDTAFDNCYRLLRPGGRIVLAGHTGPSDTDESQWSRHLLDANFTGLDIVIRDGQDESSLSSFMFVSTKPPPVELFPFTDIVVVEPTQPSEASSTLAAGVSRGLTELGYEVEQTTLENAAQLSENGKPFVSGKAVVSLVECEDPFVFNMSEADFRLVKTILLHGSGGLWVGRSASQLEPSSDPSFSATTGLLRVLRGEHPDIRMMELSLSPPMQSSSPAAAALVSKVFKSMTEAHPHFAETEVAESNGRLYIPRLLDYQPKDRSLQTLDQRPRPRMQPFVQPDRPLMLTIGAPGQLDSLHFVDDPTSAKPLNSREVEIEIHAAALNFVDVMVAMGLVADTQLGCDAAGIIKRIGPNVTLVKPGDRVAAHCFGAFCNLLRLDERLVQKLPDSMSMETGASLPTTHTTAYQGLVEIARLSPGETVLIHSAAGGLGQAAIQFAKHIGAEIFVTAGTAEKRRILVEECGIPEDHVFGSRDLTFAKGIVRMTKNKGIDVILNSLSGDALRKTWECIAPFGRFIEVGKRDVLANTGLEMNPFIRSATFASVNVEQMGRHYPDRMGLLIRKTFDMIREGAVGPVPLTVYSFSEIEKAMRLMQQGKHTGKIIFKVHPDDMVPVIPRNPHPLRFDPEATYVLVGGFGGIGRALAIFMAEHGVKNLAFLSRSGDKKPEAKTELQRLQEMGVRAVAYACDVANAAALTETSTKMSAEMPRIKGVIQSAMVLQDFYLEEMTYEAWNTSTSPKIQGTWNLHQLMPKDLDFFVMFSSISGISGNGAQGNYAAGNTFLDGLAHYRRAQGLTACTLDLGAIMGVGWMAENVQMSEEAKADWNRMSLQPPELFSLVESAMTGFAIDDTPMPTQMVTGMGTGGIGQQMQTLKTSNAFDDPKYSYLRWLDVRGVAPAAMDSTNELKAALTAATSIAQAADLIEGSLAIKLSKSLSISLDDIDPSKPIYSYGVDSLVAIEIRNWIFKELKSQLSVFDIMSRLPMSELAMKVAKKSSLVSVAEHNVNKEE